MNEMTMNGLLNLSKSQWGKEAEWMAIEVTIPNAKATEIIINRRVNFEAKLAYYQEAYGEDLVDKHVPTIKIVSYAFAPTFESLQQELGL